MRTGTASHTAADNALVRALDARRTVTERVADDRLAVHFLPAGYRLLVEAARVRPVRRLTEAIIDFGWPGPRRGVVARTRFIDELVERHAGAIDQVLILGAGFDTRAYRLDCWRGTPVFEVDHPATQAAKRRALAHVAPPAADVRFAPVDFLVDDVGQVLRASGFETAARTLVLWEGVTNYLDAGAVDATFAFIADAVGSGSPIVFTYVDAAIIQAPGAFDGARASTRRVNRQGEPFTFGLDPHEVRAFLDARGITLVDDVAVPSLVERYYGVRQTSYAYYHVVEARRS